MIKVPDLLHSTATDGKIIESVQSGYKDGSGRDFLDGVDNVKDTLDRLIKELFPLTDWSIKDFSVDYKKSTADGAYIKNIGTYSASTLVANLNLEVDKGNNKSYSVADILLNDESILQDCIIAEDKISIEYGVSLMDVIESDLVYSADSDSYTYTTTDVPSVFSKNFKITLITEYEGETLYQYSEEKEVSFTFPAGNYNDSGKWDVSSFSVSPSTSKVYGEISKTTVSWNIPSISKSDIISGVETTIEYTPVISVKLGDTEISTSQSGTLSYDLTGTTKFSISVESDSSTKDILGNAPESSTKDATITFTAPTMYFWSKTSTISSTVSGVTAYQFTSGGNYSPADTTGYYIYFLSSSKTNDFKFKRVGSDDAYYTTGADLIGTTTVTVKSGVFSIPGKTHSADISGKYYLYRSRNNVTLSQTIKCI